MKRMALIRSGTVWTVAAWDGVRPWDPIGAGLCDTLVDVTSQPTVGPGDTYSNGVFTHVPPTLPPDPAGFLRAVVEDATIATATRNALGPWLYSLAVAITAGDTGLISTEWNNLVSGLPVSSADRTAIAGYASAHNVPGIT